MYEELAKSLRICGDSVDAIDECCYEECIQHERPIDPLCMQALCNKAADAIEELSRAQEQWIAQERNVLLKSIPRWIPVTEKLPKAYEDVLLLFPHNQAAGFCDRDGCWSVYSGDGFYTEVADNEPKPTHWAKKLPEPPKEKDKG